mgnify:CR=1 FL=1
MINKRFPGIFVNFLVIMTMTACQPTLPENLSSKTTDISTTSHDTNAVQSQNAANTPPLVASARSQIGVTVGYDPSYRNLAFPMGDVDKSTGVCTDVVIRAYRDQGKDLQQLVNTDMKKAWHAYPKIWGLSKPDTNIDHRRVPNLEVFFSRHDNSLSLTDKSGFEPGDLVTWRLPQNGKDLPHIGIVSDKKTVDGTPLIIHNIGRGAEESDILYRFPITGHYRY